MTLFRVIVRVKDEDSGESQSFTEHVNCASKEDARQRGRQQVDEVLDVLPYANTSISVKEES
jgi:beta-lactamase class D